MAWSQANRPFRLITPLGEDVLLLAEWKGEEQVSSLFRFTVTAFSERGDISAKDLLLKKVSLLLRLPDGSDREIHGVVSQLTRGGSAPFGWVGYQLEIVPPHWVLDLDEGFEIFQNVSVRDIGDKLLAGTPHDWKLTGTPAPRPYTFRYRESRWNCVARLLEQEGIFFRYDHTSGDAMLIMGDSTKSAKPAWGVSTLEYNETERYLPRLTSLRVESRPYVSQTRVRTASEFLYMKNVGDVTASTGDFTPPSDVKSYRFEQQMTAHRTGISHSGGETPADAAKLTQDTKAYSRVRQERSETRSVCYFGESRYVGLEPGAKTTVEKHTNDEMNKDLFVVSVWHEGSNGSYDAGDRAEAKYTNRFEAIPATTAFRPPLVTRWPHVGGSHVGVVVGPPGEEIYPDKHGRVQVVFKWDQDDDRTLQHSCWIRVAQPFAGPNYGAVFLPRIGHEVLVEFLDGNPDNPVIVGSLYNGTNLPPWELPEHKTQSGVRTKSSLKGGADNHNELRFEDLKGKEQIWVQAEKDLDTLVKNDETRKVKHDRTTDITNHETKTVIEGNETHTIKKGWYHIRVEDNERTLHVEKNHTITVNGEESTTVAKDRKMIVKMNQEHTITQDNTSTVKGKQTETITGDDSTTVSQGNKKLDVSMGNIDVKADLGNITVKAALGKITLEAMQKIEIKCGPTSSIVIDPTGVTIKGMMVKVEGQIMTEVKGLMTTVNGSAMLTLKGGITMIN
jgi:type VI secretion system secreted protein VgrG